MELEQPNKDGGAGMFVKEVMQTADASSFRHPGYIKTINQQLNDFNALRARVMIAGETDSYYSSLISYLENELLTPEPFYHQDRFLEWYKAGNTTHLIEANNKILKQMRDELSKAKK